MIEVSTTQFEKQCLQLIEYVHAKNTEIIITKHGKPWAKLISAETSWKHFFLGSFEGVGTTVGDLLEQFEDEWECD